METTNGLSLPENLPAVQAYFISIFHILLEAPTNLKHDLYLMNITWLSLNSLKCPGTTLSARNKHKHAFAALTFLEHAVMNNAWGKSETAPHACLFRHSVSWKDSQWGLGQPAERWVIATGIKGLKRHNTMLNPGCNQYNLHSIDMWERYGGK